MQVGRRLSSLAVRRRSSISCLRVTFSPRFYRNDCAIAARSRLHASTKSQAHLPLLSWRVRCPSRLERMEAEPCLVGMGSLDGRPFCASRDGLLSCAPSIKLPASAGRPSIPRALTRLTALHVTARSQLHTHPDPAQACLCRFLVSRRAACRPSVSLSSSARKGYTMLWLPLRCDVRGRLCNVHDNRGARCDAGRLLVLRSLCRAVSLGCSCLLQRTTSSALEPTG